MEQLNLNHIFNGEPTYWPSDCRKLPDLLDFCVTKGIPRDSALPTSCLDLSSDHSPVLITLSPSVLNQAPPPRLCNSKTNWDYFLHLISTQLTLHVPLKTDSQIEDAVKYFNDIIQWAGWNATPETTYTPSSYTCPILIKQKLAEKGKLQREWQTYPDTNEQTITQQSNARPQTTPTLPQKRWNSKVSTWSHTHAFH
jgi:hypothetical protein